ncbi:uncharacterized mitochondrial protein-like protein [Tanacetum coccineum]|uniref:Uncharacterized mitochondrial protein-like protein n=1 Tax=Tanacetum coccineum TaxID=301880 RepID=A0ABQ4YBJ5_9ASTR
MDVKSAFLYGKIKEEVYVCQLPGFEDPDFLDRVYKVEKALCGYIKLPEIEGTKMSSMGELTFFLGLQVKQKNDGIFISQDKYVGEILKKFGFTDVKTASTPMETQKPLLKDEDGEEVDVHLYRSMIGSLMYLTSSRPDIMFAVCACARYQVNQKVSHLHAGKRIFRYLKGQPKLGLWYPKDSPFDLVAYTDSDYAGASLDRKSTTGDQTSVIRDCNEKKVEFKWSKIHTDKNVADLLTKAFDVVQNQSQLGEGFAIPTEPHHTPTFIQPSTQPQKTQQPRKPKRKDTQVPQPSDPIENVADEAVHKELVTDLATTENESSSQGTNSGGGPWCQETMGDTSTRTRFESVSKHFNDSLLARGNTLRSDEDRLKLNELITLCTTLQNRVLDLEQTKTTQHNEIASLKKEEITLVSVHDVNVFAGEEVFVAEQDVVEEAVEFINNAESKEKHYRHLEDSMKKERSKSCVDEETDLNLQAEFDKEERLAREKAEKEDIALIETWNDIQEKIDVDHQLAERMQAQEQEECPIEEKATLFKQHLEKRKIFFGSLKEIREKKQDPPTKSSTEQIMSLT